MNKVIWDGESPVGKTFDSLLYDIRRYDDDGLMVDPLNVADILDDAEGVYVFDALVTPFAKLERKMQIMQNVMVRTGGKVKPVAMQITEPFKQRGTANVAVVYELSDGQTLSIFFHNPDVTPQKITLSDEVISWKWMLNKKDITIIVAPERGVDLNVREVANRIMRLAERNSATFGRANAKRSERMQAIEALKVAIAEKEATLVRLQRELEVKKMERETIVVSPFVAVPKPQLAAEPALAVASVSDELPVAAENSVAVSEELILPPDDGLIPNPIIQSTELDPADQAVVTSDPIAPTVEIAPSPNNIVAPPDASEAPEKAVSEIVEATEPTKVPPVLPATGIVNFYEASDFAVAHLLAGDKSTAMVFAVNLDNGVLIGTKLIKDSKAAVTRAFNALEQIAIKQEIGEFSTKIFRAGSNNTAASLLTAKGYTIDYTPKPVADDMAEKTDAEKAQEQVAIDAYIKAWGEEADAIHAVLATVRWENISDYGSAQAEQQKLRQALTSTKRINTAKTALEAVGVELWDKRVSIQDKPEYQSLSEAMDAVRAATDKMHEIAKSAVKKAGIAELAALATDAPLEDIVSAIYKKNGLEVRGEWLARLVAAILEKDVEMLREVMGNTQNTSSREVFGRYTGIKLDKTVRGTLLQIDAWCGITPEQRTKKNAEKEAAFQALQLADDLKSSWESLQHMHVRDGSNVIDGQQYLLNQFAQGYTEVGFSKKGAATIYGMKNAQGQFTYINNRNSHSFLKSALAFGGLRRAIEAVGAEVLIAIPKPVEPAPEIVAKADPVQSSSEVPLVSPAALADTAFLKSIIDGKAEIFDPTLSANIEAVLTRNPDNPTMLATWKRAVSTYTSAMMAAATQTMTA